MSLLYEEESYSIIGAAIAVHQELGNGFLEAVYQEALEKEFQTRNIPYRRQVPIIIFYKNEPLHKFFIPDFLCYEKIIVELKAQPAITPASHAQVVNYLKASKLSLGLILNFGRKSLEHKRVVKEKR